MGSALLLGTGPTGVAGSPALAYRDTVLADSPALYWEFEETVGVTALDSSGNLRVGTHTNGPTINQTGKEGQCVSYDGTDDFTVATGYTPFTNGSQRTFEGFSWRNNTSGYHLLMGGDGAAPPRLYIQTADTKVSWEANSTFLGGANWAGAWPGTGQWVHWALTFDEAIDTAELFINGVSKGTQSETHAYATPGNFHVAKAGAANYWNGKHDEIAVYPSILSSARIAAHYAAA